MTYILADNQDLTRAGLESYISAGGGGKTLRADSKAELAALLTKEGDAIVVLDFALFDFNGAENLLIFLRRFPQARWLLLSQEFGISLLRLLSGEKAVSFVLKDSTETEIRFTLRATANGERHICPAVAEQLANLRHDHKREAEVLTTTEREVLKLVAEGKQAKEIAELRHTSIHTVIAHKKNIFRKIGVNSIYEATRYAMRAGIADPMDYYI